MIGASHPVRVLVVDDEPPIRRFLRTSLAAQAYDVLEAQDVASAVQLMREQKPDVIVLDLGLPGMDGFDLIRDLRTSGSRVPIIVLSSRTDEAGKVHALDLGADDYVTKPFGMDELIARIRTALRHRLQEHGALPLFASDHLSVDLVRRIVTVRGKGVKLTPREYDLLRLLITHAGQVLTHRQILRELWPADADVQYLRIYIRALRQKLEDDPQQPKLLLTEQGVGYRLKAAA